MVEQGEDDGFHGQSGTCRFYSPMDGVARWWHGLPAGVLPANQLLRLQWEEDGNGMCLGPWGAV